MKDTGAVADIAERIAAAIARRDTGTLRELMAPGFIHRTHGGAALAADAFLAGIERIPGEIRFVVLETLAIDVCPGGAMATGVQHAQVLLDGQVIDDRRGFVDWFVRDAGGWRIQAAVDLPAPG
jgi:hypothetical protein